MSNFYGWVNKETGVFKKTYLTRRHKEKVCVFRAWSNAQGALEQSKLTEAYQVGIICEVEA